MPSQTSCGQVERPRDRGTTARCGETGGPNRALQRAVERVLAGVTEGRVAEIVAEPDRLGQILVQAQRPRDDARDRRRLERVRHPGSVVVALRVDEDLRLALQPPERLRVDDAVAVALERRPHAARLLRRARGRASRTSARRAATATAPRAPARAPSKVSATLPASSGITARVVAAAARSRGPSAAARRKQRPHPGWGSLPPPSRSTISPAGLAGVPIAGRTPPRSRVCWITIVPIAGRRGGTGRVAHAGQATGSSRSISSRLR